MEVRDEHGTLTTRDYALARAGSALRQALSEENDRRDERKRLGSDLAEIRLEHGDIQSHLRGEVEQKRAAKKELEQECTRLREEIENVKQRSKEELARLEREKENEVNRLKEQMDKHDIKLKELKPVEERKTKLEREVQETREEIKRKEGMISAEREQSEWEAILRRDKQPRELAAAVEETRNRMRDLVTDQIGTTTRRILWESEQLTGELEDISHSVHTECKENDRLLDRESALRRQVDISASVNTILDKKCRDQERRNEELLEKIRHLDAQRRRSENNLASVRSEHSHLQSQLENAKSLLSETEKEERRLSSQLSSSTSSLPNDLQQLASTLKPLLDEVKRSAFENHHHDCTVNRLVDAPADVRNEALSYLLALIHELAVSGSLPHLEAPVAHGGEGQRSGKRLATKGVQAVSPIPAQLDSTANRRGAPSGRDWGPAVPNVPSLGQPRPSSRKGTEYARKSKRKPFPFPQSA